ncbi:helix-turn-helix domain-containing protein [Arthrobacter alpinus]|nr:helix-turn-helix transcriptional regulator [Arthrobacter alpinus]
MSDLEDKKILALGKAIKMEMVGQDLTQKVLADKIGIHRETLSRYLSGAAGYNMPIGILFQISNTLGVSVQDLVERAEARL